MKQMAINETFGCSYDNSFADVFRGLLIPVTAVADILSILVIFIVCHNVTLHTNTNVLVASSSLTHIILSLAYDSALIPSAYENKTVLNFMFGISFSTIFISVIHISLISIDRYIQIAHPFYYISHMTKGLVFKILIVVWIMGLVYMIFPMLVYTNDKYHEKCIVINPPPEYYSVVATAYAASLIIVFFCYHQIAILAFNHKKAANARRLQIEDPDSTVVLKNTRKAAFRSVKFFAIMFGIFACCTLPPMVLSGLNMFYRLPNKILMGVVIFLPVNSLANILIYMTMSREFSKVLKMTFLSIKQHCCK